MNRITYTVTQFFGRYRATVFIDSLPVEKAFFDTEGKARQWCESKCRELAQEIRV